MWKRVDQETWEKKEEIFFLTCLLALGLLIGLLRPVPASWLLRVQGEKGLDALGGDRIWLKLLTLSATLSCLCQTLWSAPPLIHPHPTSHLMLHLPLPPKGLLKPQQVVSYGHKVHSAVRTPVPVAVAHLGIGSLVSWGRIMWPESQWNLRWPIWEVIWTWLPLVWASHQ